MYINIPDYHNWHTLILYYQLVKDVQASLDRQVGSR